VTDLDGLARVTVNAPHRRVDVALPEHEPLAELLPELLRQAGDGLADVGQAHGGWVLRRTDGVALAVSAGLASQGVRDGAVLHLVPARTGWPELEYDDVVDAIAAGARRYGRSWDGAATRATALGLGALAALLGLVLLLRTPGDPPATALVSLAAAALLLFAGALASRAYGDAMAGAALAAYALPYAALGGLTTVLTKGPGRFDGPHLLVGAMAVLLASVAGALGVGAVLRLFVAGAVLGCAGVLGAVAEVWLTPAGAAALVLTVLVTGLLAVPLLAVRLGKLPVPVPVPVRVGVPEPAQPDAERVFAAVIRADELLTGALTGVALGALLADLWLVRSGGVGGRVLVAVAAGALLLRARVFLAVRQRLPLMLAGAGGAVTLLAAVPLSRSVAVPLAGLLVLAVLVIVLAGSAYRRTAPGPYLGRAADILDALCVVSVIPAACAVLGLYGLLAHLSP
jgi:type VII secretion integral membrane protein EccD